MLIASRISLPAFLASKIETDPGEIFKRKYKHAVMTDGQTQPRPALLSERDVDSVRARISRGQELFLPKISNAARAQSDRRMENS